MIRLTNEQIETVKSQYSGMNTKNDFVGVLNLILDILYAQKVPPFQLKEICYYAHPKYRENHYYHFTIKKKNGKERQIYAPCKRLKQIQSCLNILLQILYEPYLSENSYGFVPHKSIVDNARIHVGNKCVYNIDLQDFFHSVMQWKIKSLLKEPPFNLNYENGRIDIASLISALCCKTIETPDGKIIDALPQGAPTSPILSNIACASLDEQLSLFATDNHLHYSRYADDITFSGEKFSYNNRKRRKKWLKRMRQRIMNRFQLLRKRVQFDSRSLVHEVVDIIASEGFVVNTSKMHLQKSGYRQEVTGLIVNQKVNVRRKYVKQLRQWLYYWEEYGFKKAYILFCFSYKKDKGHIKPGSSSFVRVLEGKLNFLKMVKGENDPTYLKLKERYDRLIANPNPQKKKKTAGKPASSKEKNAVEKTTSQRTKKSTEKSAFSKEKKVVSKPTSQRTKRTAGKSSPQRAKVAAEKLNALLKAEAAKKSNQPDAVSPMPLPKPKNLFQRIWKKLFHGE